MTLQDDDGELVRMENDLLFGTAPEPEVDIRTLVCIALVPGGKAPSSCVCVLDGKLRMSQ